ncbi:hypothetical protein [Fluviibacterium sp. S390]|uniref:hypothetical protein n=1 Tax=Fluviibacterium sp. S390 TaxID=3415139 RepID=UPI003C7AA409
MADEQRPGQGKAKQAFNQAAPKTGHTSREFNRQAKVPPSHYTRDIRQNRPNGPGFGPKGQKKDYRKNMNRYDSEQGKGRDARGNAKDMIRLKDKFNEKSRGR